MDLVPFGKGLAVDGAYVLVTLPAQIADQVTTDKATGSGHKDEVSFENHDAPWTSKYHRRSCCLRDLSRICVSQTVRECPCHALETTTCVMRAMRCSFYLLSQSRLPL